MRSRLTLAAALAAGIVGGVVGLWSLRQGPVPVEGPARSASGGVPGATPVASEVGARPPEGAAGVDPAPGAAEAAAATGGSDGLFVAGRAFAESLEDPLEREEIRVRLRQGDRSDLLCITTGAEGELRIPGLEPGRIILTFEHARFRPQVVDVSLAAGASITDLAVVFERSVGVWGLVLGLDERPAPDMFVEWSRSQHALKPVSAVTDQVGRYELNGLEPGPYLVRVVPKLAARAWEDAPRRHVTLREGAANRFDITTDAGRDLAVLVLDREGRAAAGVQVRFELRTAARGVSGFLPATGGEGRTLFRGLPRAGTLSLDIPAGGIPAGGEALELDLEKIPAEARLALR